MLLILIVTIGIGVNTNDEYIKNITTNITSMSVLSILATIVIEQVKSTIAFAFEKKKLAYDISMNSQFAYDVHTEYLDFCKKYVKKVYLITENMFHEGGTSQCLSYSHELYEIRKESSVLIPETVHNELKNFEYTLRVLGAEYGFQQDTINSEQHDIARKGSIERTHKLFLQLMDLNNEDHDKTIMNREEIISYIRNTVGINKINELKHDILEGSV